MKPMSHPRIHATCSVMVLLIVAGCGTAQQKSGDSSNAGGSQTAARVARYTVPMGEMPAKCVRRAPDHISPNTWPPTRRELAPKGAIAIRLCRYGVLPGVRLQGATLLTAPSAVKRLVADFDSLPKEPRRVVCPVDLGSGIVALVTYRAGPRVAIAVHLTGCALAMNGNLIRSASGFATTSRSGPELLAQLRRLTSSPKPLS